MLQGYTLKETQCDKCGMPMMEFKGKVDCVVCPALVKKAKKKLKAQQRQADEAVRLEREMASKKKQQEEEEKRKAEEAAVAQQKIRDLEIAREKARELAEAEKLVERLQFEREERQRQAAEEVKIRQEAEKIRIAALEAEESRLVAEAAAREAEEVRLAEMAREEEERMLKSIEFNEKERKLVMEQYCRENEARLLEEQKTVEEKRRLEEIHIQEETKRLEMLHNLSKNLRLSKTENMRADILKQEHTIRLKEKAKLDNEISRLEQDRIAEEMESRRLAEERRANEESMMIQTLEEDAAEKARAAEKAILKAKAALSQVSSARREIIAQTIAMAEAEAVAEAEQGIKAHREDYRAPTILPSASELRKERWETLRTESRSVMTRRVMAGWTLLPEFCVGTECENAPLVAKGVIKECVVCGGCGNGIDGAYEIPSEELVHEANIHTGPDEELAKLRETGAHPDALKASGYEDPSPIPESSSTMRTLEEIQVDFESKRNTVSKEIGKRMMKGWTLIDTSCPRCSMPLMMDDKGRSNICVLCGLISAFEISDGSTIQTETVSKPQDGTILQSASATSDVEAVLPGGNNRAAFETEAGLPTAPTMEDSSELQRADAATEHAKKMDISEFLAAAIQQSSRSEVQETPNGSDPPKGSDPPASKKRPTPKKTKLEPGDAPDTELAKNISRDSRPEVAKSISKEANADIVVLKSLSRGSEVIVTKSFSKEAAGVSEEGETFTVTIPKDFDFNSEAALKSMQSVVASVRSGSSTTTPRKSQAKDQADDVSPPPKKIDLRDDDEDDETGLIEVTNSGTIFTAADAMSSESILNMFMRSPMGVEAKHNNGKDVNFDDVLDLVQVFVALNFNEKVPDETLQQVARDIVSEADGTGAGSQSREIHGCIQSRSPESPKTKEPEVIHLEDYRPTPDFKAPKAFNFDSVDEERKVADIPAKPVSTRKCAPTPEAISRARKRPPRSKMPPRPDRGMAPSPRNRIPSPQKSPRRRMVIVGGPSERDHTNELTSVRSGVSRTSQVSRASTVASEALTSILSRIEDCKATMARPGVDLDTQLKTADLMEKLAAAAVAMQKLEDM